MSKYTDKEGQLSSDDALLRAVLEKAMLKAGEQILDEAGDQDIQYSEHHRRELDRIFASTIEQPEETKSRWPLRRMVASILVVILVFSLSVEASRNAIVYAIQEFADRWQMLFYEDLPSTPLGADALSFSIPTYKPEGFVEHKESELLSRYIHEDGRYIFFTSSPILSISPAYDKEDYQIEEIKFHGYPMWIMNSLIEEKVNMVIWMTETTMYSLSGYVSVEELKKMAESTKEE